jgi:hypothetical protein
LVIFMRLTEKLVFPHGNDESAPSILMGWRAAATSFEPQLALPPVATRNGPAQPMRIGAGTASEETAKLEASGWGWVHRCFRSIKFPPEIPEEPEFVAAVADEAYIAHATPGGQLEKLARKLTNWDVPLRP